MFVISVL